MKFLVLLLALCSLGANWHDCRLRRVIDGDTVVADVRLDFGIVLADERLRLVGFDAVELRAPGGAAAKLALERLLAGGCQASPGATKYNSRDHFGRLLVFLFVKDIGDVGTEMKRLGHGKPFQKKR